MKKKKKNTNTNAKTISNAIEENRKNYNENKNKNKFVNSKTANKVMEINLNYSTIQTHTNIVHLSEFVWICIYVYTYDVCVFFL